MLPSYNNYYFLFSSFEIVLYTVIKFTAFTFSSVDNLIFFAWSSLKFTSISFRYLEYLSLKYVCCAFFMISSLFFSKRRENGKNDGGEEAEGQIPMLGMMFKNISPLLWEAALPILLRWGLGRVGNLFKKRPKR